MGIAEYGEANLESLPVLIQSLASLGAEAELGKDFAAARMVQLEQKGKVSDAKTGTTAA